MKNNNLHDYLDNPEVTQAIILGTLEKTFGKVQVGKYNLFAKEFELEKANKGDIQYLLERVESVPELHAFYMGAINGGADIDTLRSLKGADKPSVFDTVTPYMVSNQQVLANNREFSKIQREGAYLNNLISGLQDHLVKEFGNFEVPRYISRELRVQGRGTDKEMVLCLSDWHIGAYVNNIDTGGYNFDLFQERLNKLIQQAIQVIKDQEIRTVHVYHIGDMIEHINMRNVNQAFEAEFPATEQMAKGIRVLVETLNLLASTGVKVTFGMTGGNHDRFQGNKNDKIYNDNVAYLVIDQLFFIDELGGLHKNVTLIDNRSDVYSFMDTVAGKRVKVVHGDHEGKKVDVKIPKHIKEEVIDYLLMGHIHTTRIIQEDYSRFHVYVGSPMGANNYSAENNLPTTAPAQLIMVLNPTEDTPMFMPVFL